jgi:hypothetical protein
VVFVESDELPQAAHRRVHLTYGMQFVAFDEDGGQRGMNNA